MSYPVLNASDVPALLTYANTVGEGFLGVGLMLSVYFVVLIYLIMRGEFMLDSAVIAGWVGVGSGSFIYLLGLLSNAQFFILFAAMTLPLILVWFSRDKE